MAGWSRRGSTTAWRRLRLAVLERDGWRCQVPVDGAVCGAPARTVGHLDPRAEGGPLLAAMGRLRAECGPHNYAEGARLGHRLRLARVLGDRGWGW